MELNVAKGVLKSIKKSDASGCVCQASILFEAGCQSDRERSIVKDDKGGSDKRTAYSCQQYY